MVSDAPLERGCGGPCVRFEGITLELSSYSGCQFDFGKEGNLVLTFDGYCGTVTLTSAEHHAQAHPLCSTGSEAGSLGVLEDAEGHVAMDQSDYDMALSQLEQGDSPKSTSSVPSPSTMLFNSPSAMRQACEGKQEDDAPTNKIASSRHATSTDAEVSLAALVSPSSSVKNINAVNHTAAQSPTVAGAPNKRSAPSPGADTSSSAAGGKTVTPVAPSSAGLSGFSNKPKGKRLRRAREGSVAVVAGGAAEPTPLSRKRLGKENNDGNNGPSRAGTVEESEGKSGGGGGGAAAVEEEQSLSAVGSPSSSAAAAWIGSTVPSSHGPLSRSAKAQV